jgi:hypothetical protein
MHTDATNDNISTTSINTCSICLTELKKDIITLKCNHTYHNDCILLWKNKNNTCPLCRDIITINNKNTSSSKVYPINTQTTIIIQANPISLPTNYSTNNSTNNSTNIFFSDFTIKKIKKYSLYTIFWSCFLVYVTFSFYNNIIILKANKYINNFIKDKNHTEIDNKDSNTFDAGVLVSFDIVYIFMFTFIHIYIIMCKRNNICHFMLLGSSLLTVLLLHGAFYKNTNSYLSNKVININNEYYNYHLNLSITFFFISLAFKLPISFLLYVHNIN